MKPIVLGIAAVLCPALCRLAAASQADDTSITITATTSGITPFIIQVSLSASDPNVIKSIEFAITPKPGSKTRPLSGTYTKDYLSTGGYLNLETGEIFLPVYGLYAAFTNTITLTYNFLDGSSSQATTNFTSDGFTSACGFESPLRLQPRSDDTSLSYDYFLVRGGCSVSPIIMDTDGEVRWTSPLNTTFIIDSSSTFFENAIYVTRDSQLYRVDLDGTVTLLADYSALGVTNFHHNIDRGKTGLVLDADTTSFLESLNLEVDAAGNVLKTWNLADIISAAMVAGGDDPSQFVFPTPIDWFHNNAVTYKRSNDSMIVSSRENFIISLDHETDAIQWILGDETKKWFQFPSLAQFSLALAPDTLPPIGQHALSITLDNHLLLMDNGRNSLVQDPPGLNRDYSIPRKYDINPAAGQAAEIPDYPGDENIYTQFCGSAYEDAKANYLVDYAFITIGQDMFAEILGYNASGAKVFHYQYPTGGCSTAYNSLPLHLESTKFPAIGPQALNISSRGFIGLDENALIGGFIITGSNPKTVVLRAIGPSLSDAGVADALVDPVLNIYGSNGALIATNDNWQADGAAAQISANRLAPGDPSESATLQTLLPGAYTAVVTGKDGATGIGLVEAYDVSPQAGSVLANISTRAHVGAGEEALIGGFIVGDVDSATVILRGLGPSLSSFNIAQPLADPTLAVYDNNGLAIASNDNWQDDASAADIAQNGFSPADSKESALLLNLPAGTYSAILKGVADGVGVGLLEVYDLRD